MSRYLLFATGALVALIIYKGYALYTELNIAQTRARQVEGFLSEKERELVKLRTDFNITESNLKASIRTLEADAAQMRERYGNTSAEFEAFRKAHDLQIQQMQRVEFSLRQRLSTSSGARATPSPPPPRTPGCPPHPPAPYSYEDGHHRISFKTPDCLSSGGETLELNQKFVVYGEVHQQKNGALQVSNLFLHEVSPLDSALVLSSAQMISGEFKYFAQPIPTQPTKPFHITAGFGLTSSKHTSAALGFVPLVWRPYYLSINALYSNGRAGSSLNLGVRPQPFMSDLNLGVSVGVGSTLPDLSLVFTAQLDFFIW